MEASLSNLINTKIKSIRGKGLLETDKEEIRKHIEKIKVIVSGAGLTQSKANAINQKLNSLLKEIDRFGTSLDVIMGGMVEIAIYTSQIVKISKPVIAEIKDVLKIVYNKKADEIGIALPKPEVNKLIEGTTPTDEED